MSARLRELADSPVWPVLEPPFSAGVWASSMAVMTATAATAFALTPVIPFKDSHPYVGARGMATCIRLTGSDLRIQFDPGFDPERRSLFCQNHISLLDGHVACAVIPHAFCGLMNHWHFHVPGYGWIMRMANGIPVFPKSSGRTAEITDAARDRIARGISILAFPEAHRTLDGRVRDYHRGVFFMARDAGIPVVPLAVRGLYEVNHKGEWRFRPGVIDVAVGPQVETAGLDDDGVARLAAAMRAYNARWVDDGVADAELLATVRS